MYLKIIIKFEGMLMNRCGKMCPMFKEACKKKDCEWWNINENSCSINLLVHTLNFKQFQYQKY